MAIIVDPITGEEWDNERKDYREIEVNGKKYKVVTDEALKCDTSIKFSSGRNQTAPPVEPNTRFRIGSHWKKSKSIKSRKVL